MCWELMEFDWDTVILHSYREVNRAADVLAKLACSQEQDMIIHLNPSFSMELILHENILGCPIPRVIPAMGESSIF